MELFRNKRVWLYFDSHNSLDNGYYQFLHDIEKKDGIERYYVYLPHLFFAIHIGQLGMHDAVLEINDIIME